MKKILLFLIFIFSISFSYRIDLYYTEDGREIKSIKGYEINKDFTIDFQGNESWLIFAGQKIGPNGYAPKQSKITIGTLGKKTDQLIQKDKAFLGIGNNKRFESSLKWDQIEYILPGNSSIDPLIVHTTDGRDGNLFIDKVYTESTGVKRLPNKTIKQIFIIKLKYNIPKSQRKPSTMPLQIGIQAKAVSFSEHGLRKAMRKHNLR